MSNSHIQYYGPYKIKIQLLLALLFQREACYGTVATLFCSKQFYRKIQGKSTIMKKSKIHIYIFSKSKQDMTEITTEARSFS